tara:strand:+ start:147299 stop:148615 length:1317 start_codon:yes stop_codon:yes gene_type:complete
MNNEETSMQDEALNYHKIDPPGKLAIFTTKPANTQWDLTLAYSPGVAAPCMEIHNNEEDSYVYTGKGNLVAVVSNGTAVLGLGNIGPSASKPVMEGKGVLFKRFADINVFDIEISPTTVEEVVSTVKALEPTFGGINLEDIKAPECFEIERQLRSKLDIPVFHDDQHGTAIISGAALLNAADIISKDISNLKIVFSGAGASAIATAKFYVSLGAKKENIVMVDSKGILSKSREDINEYKQEFASEEDGNIADAMVDSDVFVGLSVGGLVSEEMVQSMASDPIIFAMANPDPEIGYYEAKAVRDDTVIMATGRSDFPNQVNNVLGFPFIFRGALDVRAKDINEDMKVAASQALADLAQKDVIDDVIEAYGGEKIEFGPDYIIPKPVDPRVLFEVAPKVAEAAITSGVARHSIDLDDYRKNLESRLKKSQMANDMALNSL